MNCSKCNNSNLPEAKFCASCGAPLVEAASKPLIISRSEILKRKKEVIGVLLFIFLPGYIILLCVGDSRPLSFISGFFFTAGFGWLVGATMGVILGLQVKSGGTSFGKNDPKIKKELMKYVENVKYSIIMGTGIGIGLLIIFLGIFLLAIPLLKKSPIDMMVGFLGMTGFVIGFVPSFIVGLILIKKWFK